MTFKDWLSDKSCNEDITPVSAVGGTLSRFANINQNPDLVNKERMVATSLSKQNLPFPKQVNLLFQNIDTIFGTNKQQALQALQYAIQYVKQKSVMPANNPINTTRGY